MYWRYIKRLIPSVQKIVANIIPKEEGDYFFGPPWAIQIILDCLGQFEPPLTTLGQFGPKLAQKSGHPT